MLTGGNPLLESPGGSDSRCKLRVASRECWVLSGREYWEPL